MTAKMHSDAGGRVIPCTLHAGGSIGLRHETGGDINYILPGTGRAVCDGREEALCAGVCHICKKGPEHSITNTGCKGLVMLPVMVEW